MPGIAGVLDHFRHRGGHHELAPAPLQRHLAHQSARSLVVGTQHDDAGLVVVTDRRAFAQELGIDRDAERFPSPPAHSALEHWRHHACQRAGQHRRTHGDRVEGPLLRDGPADHLADAHHLREVEIAIREARRADADEAEFRGRNRLRTVSRGMQPSRGDRLGDQRREPRLDDRRAPGIDGLDLLPARIHRHHAMAIARKAGGGHSADVTDPEYGDAHRPTCPA